MWVFLCLNFGVFMSVIANLLRDILDALGSIGGGGSSGGATEAKQDIGNTSLANINSKTPNLVNGSVPVYVTNQLDITTISSYLLDIKNSCADIDANTDAVESKLDSIVSAINANGAVNHADLLSVVTELQAVDANTDAQESILTNILNKLIPAPATLAEQQTQTTTLLSILARLPALLLGKIQTLATDYLIEVARGNIPDESRLELRGYNKNVGSAALEPVWANSGASYPLITSAQTFTLSSSDVDDTLAGNGAKVVFVRYIEFSTGNEIATTVNMNGRNGAIFTTDGYAINELRVISVGSSNGNEGTIYAGSGTITTGVPQNILSTIDVGTNVSQQLIYTVPTGKQAEIYSYGVSMSKLFDVQLDIRPSKLSGLIYAEYNIPVNGTTPTPLLSVPIILTAGQQILIYAKASTTTGLIGITMRGIVRSV